MSRALPPPALRPHSAPVEPVLAFATRDSAGVVIAENGNVGAWGAELVPLVEEARFGVAFATQDQQFNAISHLEGSRDGRVVVADRSAVRLFDADGELLRTLATRGEGPDEFRTVFRMWLSGDTLILVDQSLPRLTWLPLDGGPGKARRLFNASGQIYLPLSVDGSRWSVVIPQVGTAEAGPEPIEQEELWAFGAPAQRILGWDPSAESATGVLFEVPGPTRYAEGERELPRPGLFEPQASWAVLPDGRIVTTRPLEYQIELRRSDGTLERVVRRDFDPVPIADADLEALDSRYYDHLYDDRRTRDPDATRFEVRALSRLNADREVRARVEWPRPRHMPPTGAIFAVPSHRWPGLLVDREGAFWIRRQDVVTPDIWGLARLVGEYAASREVQPLGVSSSGEVFVRSFALGAWGSHPLDLPSRWDLFDREGRFLGTCELPARFVPRFVDGTSVVGVWSDEMGVESVVRYRVDGGMPG